MKFNGGETWNFGTNRIDNTQAQNHTADNWERAQHIRDYVSFKLDQI